MIATILIANRGEIACRIIRTCFRLGIRPVAVFSDADAEGRHVRLASEAIHIGPSPASQSYLDQEAIIAAALKVGADAIHPGFGFLAENHEFAGSCAAAELLFIGPSPQAIEAMGDKRAARDLMIAAGIPVIPGYHGVDSSDERLEKEAERLGFPVMVKAAAGGGGKGMRVVNEPAELPDALASSRTEAGNAFGDQSLLLEQPLSRPRHIEFQIFGDGQGNIIHLGERECSIQRRYQKIIEESPSPALNAALRERMGQTAVAAARTVQYTNAGTVEFLLDASGEFYFLEMNTRLQVEHPVTEMVTGLDLVEWQIRVAEGEPLPLSQNQIEQKGHAIEARLYAEDPANGFLPTTGRVLCWRHAEQEGVRLESGIQDGDEISAFYDPMLAKIVAHGWNRRTAVRRLLRALDETTLLGVTTNLDFLQAVLSHPAFQDGQLHTHFLEEHLQEWRPGAADLPVALMVATLVQFVDSVPEGRGGYWRNNPNRPHLASFLADGNHEPIKVAMSPLPNPGRAYQFQLLGHEFRLQLNEQQGSTWVITTDGHRQRLMVVASDDKWWVKTRTGVVTLTAIPRLPKPAPSAGAGGSLRAPMTGSVLEVLVEVGQRVSKGQPLMKLEAMKMEHTVRTVADGVIEAIYFSPGDTVEADAQLLRIAEAEKKNRQI